MTQARIYDRGYLAYSGPRHSPSRAMFNLAVHAMQRVLGLKRSNWQKVMPAIALLAAFVPAIVFIGLAAVIPDTGDLNLGEPADYYELINLVLFLFASFVAPEAVCTDRRSGMLGLYLASPLNRDTYLIAKFGAVVAVLGTMSIGPTLLMLIAYTLQGVGPGGTTEWLVELGRVLATGVAVAVLWAGLSMAVSSLTPSRTRASVAIFVGFWITVLVSEALSENFELGDSFALASMWNLPIELAYRIYGQANPMDEPISRVETWELYAALIGSVAVFGWFTRWRYQKIEISK